MYTYQKLVRTILSKLKYNTMQEQLKMVFRDRVSNTKDLYYGNCYSNWYNPGFRGNNRYNTNNNDSGN